MKPGRDVSLLPYQLSLSQSGCIGVDPYIIHIPLGLCSSLLHAMYISLMGFIGICDTFSVTN